MNFNQLDGARIDSEGVVTLNQPESRVRVSRSQGSRANTSTVDSFLHHHTHDLDIHSILHINKIAIIFHAAAKEGEERLPAGEKRWQDNANE